MCLSLELYFLLFLLSPTAVGVLFSESAMGYNTTEANNTVVEVCIEVVIGTVNQIASVNVQTVGQSATGLHISS